MADVWKYIHTLLSILKQVTFFFYVHLGLPLDQLRTRKPPQGRTTLAHFKFNGDSDASPGRQHAPSVTLTSRTPHSPRTHSRPPSRLPASPHASLHSVFGRLHEHRRSPRASESLMHAVHSPRDSPSRNGPACPTYGHRRYPLALALAPARAAAPPPLRGPRSSVSPYTASDVGQHRQPAPAPRVRTFRAFQVRALTHPATPSLPPPPPPPLPPRTPSDLHRLHREQRESSFLRARALCLIPADLALVCLASPVHI
ncbi:hypothetical protein MVEN_02319000 [Mycena venus]|uniref:Uncharacterized protein n=1 Tax=Mycena venus TaxID=2733690 RepID=A0A8H6X4Q5_9AGAR|nr:hypothetical protein MVEN_02319000 [Mycena venus]